MKIRLFWVEAPPEILRKSGLSHLRIETREVYAEIIGTENYFFSLLNIFSSRAQNVFGQAQPGPVRLWHRG